MSENTKVHPATLTPPDHVPTPPKQKELKTLIVFNEVEFLICDENDPKSALEELYCWWGGRLEKSVFKQAVSGITYLNDVIELIEACTHDLSINNIFCNCESIYTDRKD